MTALLPKKKSFSDFQVKYNEIAIDDLFDKYEEIGFIYPEKKALLKPHFKQITENWKNLLKSTEQFLWVFSDDNKETGNFASICAWKQSNYGLQAQHLVSSGNPFLSLKVMLAAQYKAEHHYGSSDIRSSQNWFRPNNRYAFRVFASMYEKLGPEKSALTSFQILQLPVANLPKYYDSDFQVEEVTGIDEELIEFVNQRYGNVFVRAEELDQEDIQLKELGESFEQYQLHRSRKVLKIRDKRTGEIIASVVANRAPIGLNFSYLENKAYYILDRDLDAVTRSRVLDVMNASIKSYYEDFPVGAIPIATDTLSSDALQTKGAIWLREYMQSIWMREGFTQWYEHINSFLQKIEQRLNRKNAVNPKVSVRPSNRINKEIEPAAAK